jgi:curved DNA-binding protein CbpA
MSSASAGKFQDHYKILGVDSKSTPDIIQLAYNALADVYNVETGTQPDEQKFEEIKLAQEVLTEPNSRKMFDAVRGGDDEREISFSGMEFFNSLQDEVNCRMTMLCILYDVRRQNPRVPLITMRQFEQIAEMTEIQIQLSLWYVKTLGFVSVDDKSKLQITASGMDYLLQNIPDPAKVWPFLKNPSGPRPEETVLAQQEKETRNLSALSTALSSLAEPGPVTLQAAVVEVQQPKPDPPPQQQPFVPQQPKPLSSPHMQEIEVQRPKVMSMLRRASVSVTEA